MCQHKKQLTGILHGRYSFEVEESSRVPPPENDLFTKIYSLVSGKGFFLFEQKKDFSFL